MSSAIISQVSMMSSSLISRARAREAGNHADGDDPIYFAVGNDDVEGCWPNLSWAARNFRGQKICFLHVLLIPSEQAHQDDAKRRILEMLKKYLVMLGGSGSGFQGNIVYIKKEKVEVGIVKLISRLRVKNLVMGAAAREMVYIETKITKHVCEKGSTACQIWFVHEGHLIKTRYDEQVMGSSSFRKETYLEWLKHEETGKDSAQAEAVCNAETSEKLRSEEMQSVEETEDASIGDTCDWSGGSQISAISDTYAPSAPPIVDFLPGEEILLEAVDDELFEKLEQAMAEADSSKREAFEESLRRRKAENDAIQAIRKARAAEKKYMEEVRLRKEAADELESQERKLEKMGNQLYAATEELSSTLREKLWLEDEVADLKKNLVRLNEKIAAFAEQQYKGKNERDELKTERDRALKAAEELRHLAESSNSGSSTGLPHLLSDFSYSDIQAATGNFHPSNIIDEREHRSTYKGVLRHTEVAVKVLRADSSEGVTEYRQEVEALSRIRHPNVVTFIGACPEALAIIYEHFPNGSLEDRLNRKHDSPPLPWQTRIRIATDICSVLIFLHKSKPHAVIHGDLKPCNILLDAHFTSKLSHFGLSRAITASDLTHVNRLGNVLMKLATQQTDDGGSSQSSSSINPATPRGLKPSDTFMYMDLESVITDYFTPEVITDDFTPELDVYSFGIILLRLLTGKEAWGITKGVQRALEDGTFNSSLDCSAGDWPYRHARQLARIALRCADVSRKNRPDLEEVLEVLETMKASSQQPNSSTSYHHDGDQPFLPPPLRYFLCPISQEVMQDPYVAADGFTYEKDAIQGWLLSCHDTSPMTNLKLAHKKLVPNRTLHSAIQDWLHRR